jgi:hypothetical protein
VFGVAIWQGMVWEGILHCASVKKHMVSALAVLMSRAATPHRNRADDMLVWCLNADVCGWRIGCEVTDPHGRHLL